MKKSLLLLLFAVLLSISCTQVMLPDYEVQSGNLSERTENNSWVIRIPDNVKNISEVNVSIGGVTGYLHAEKFEGVLQYLENNIIYLCDGKSSLQTGYKYKVTLFY